MKFAIKSTKDISCSSAPWITNEIRHKINKRYKLFKAAVTEKCPELWQNYKQARNEVTAALRKAKASYFERENIRGGKEIECLMEVNQ